MPINFAIKLAATVAIEALQVGLQASQHTYGPRLSETQVTTADYGTLLPRFLGARRFSGQIVWSKDLEIVDETHKIKGGGKQTTQSARWTAGIAIADVRGGIGPIDKVLKIWLDETLAYDATGKGPISYASSLGFDLTTVMRIYTGGEDQAADPAYVDYCEARYGSNSATAFRGTAMLVFDRMPCDNFGNRPPQISVLATVAANDSFPFDTRTTTRSVAANFAFQPNGTWGAYCDESVLEWWDVPTRTLIGTSPAAGTMSGLTTNTSLSADGTAWVAGPVLPSADVYLFSISPLGVPSPIHTDAPTAFLGVTRALDTVDGVRVFTGYDSHVGYLEGGSHIALADCAIDWCVDDEGVVWMVSQPVGASSNFTLTNLTTGVATIFTGTARSATSAARLCYVASEGHFFVYTDGHYYFIPRDTMTIASSVAGSFPTQLPEQDPNRTSFWNSFSEISLVDGSLIRAMNQNSWVNPSSYHANPSFDPVNHAIWARLASSQTLRVLYVDRTASSGTTLGAVVSQMCDDAGLIDRDTSLLTQPVAGYSWTRGDVKSQMEPVLDIHDVDACPHDFTLVFQPRGTASSGTIATADFAKNGDEPRYKLSEKQDTDLPKLLRVNFADTGFDQETNNILSPLPIDAVDSQRDITIDLTTYADAPDSAQQKGDRYMRRAWNGKDGIENSLTAQEFALEPGDVKTLDLDGVQWTARLEKQTFVGSRIDCSWVRDEPTLAVLNPATTGPDMDGRDGDAILFPAPIRGFVIDAPFREDGDQDVRPLLYSAAGAYGQLTFPGSSIWEQTGAGSGAAYDQLFATERSGATWGLCTTTLHDVPSPWLWDRGNTLTVSLQAGSLTSVAEADIAADPTLNLILVGRQGAWEYVNFTTATLNGDGTYTLSGFKRGRRGTEWACGGHGSGEAFILASSLDVDEMGNDDVGDSFSFKAQSLGRSLAAAPVIDVAPYTGASLKPYAPARLKWTTDGTDMFGEIVRRTRLGGAWVGGTTIPLSEASEAYEVEIYHGSTLKRTITVTGTNLFTYAAADIAADSNSVGVAPPANVYQLSDAVGRGFALAA